MECRCLLSSVSFADGVLQVSLEADESLMLSSSRGDVTVQVDRDVQRLDVAAVEVLVTGGAGDNRIDLSHLLAAKFPELSLISVTGEAGNDTLIGSPLTDHLDGGAGRDVIRGGGGNDSLWGGSGNDRLFGGNGTDWLDGGAGRDTIAGGARRDRIVMSTPADVIHDASWHSVAALPTSTDTHTFALAASSMPATDAIDDLYAASNLTPLSVPVSGVLSNDMGAGLTAVPWTGLTALGATVTLAADGSFNYDPTTSSILAALPSPGTASDSFSYTAQGSDLTTDNAVVNISVVCNSSGSSGSSGSSDSSGSSGSSDSSGSSGSSDSSGSSGSSDSSGSSGSSESSGSSGSSDSSGSSGSSDSSGSSGSSDSSGSSGSSDSSGSSGSSDSSGSSGSSDSSGSSGSSDSSGSSGSSDSSGSSGSSSPSATNDGTYETMDRVNLTLFPITNDFYGSFALVSIIIVQQPLHGLLVVNADKSLTFDADNDFEGADLGKYKLVENGLASNVALINFNVISPRIVQIRLQDDGSGLAITTPVDITDSAGETVEISQRILLRVERKNGALFGANHFWTVPGMALQGWRSIISIAS